MSPAAMYSFDLATIGHVVLGRHVRGCCREASRRDHRRKAHAQILVSSASWIFCRAGPRRGNRRSWPSTRFFGRTVVTTVISSFTASKITITRAASEMRRAAHGIGLGARQLLDQPHRVVAQIAEHTRRHGRQLRRKLDGQFRKQRAERGKRG